MRCQVLAVLTTVLLMGGCATAAQRAVRAVADSYGEHVYGLWTDTQAVPLFGSGNAPTFSRATGAQLVTRDCPPAAFNGRPMPVWQGGVPVPCVEVPGTRDPADTAYWKFDLYFIDQVVIPGPFWIPIPVSPRYKSGRTIPVGVVGEQAACESVRLVYDRKPPGIAGDATMHMAAPTCTGPFYIRLAAPTAAR